MRKISEWIKELPDNARYTAMREFNYVLQLDVCSLISALYTIRAKCHESNYDYWTGVIMETRNRNTEKVAGCAPVMDAPRLASHDGSWTLGVYSNMDEAAPTFKGGYRATDSDQVETSYQE